MKELQTIVQQQIGTMISSGAIEEMIQTRLNTAIKDSIDSAMRSYSSFGKTLESKIEASLSGAISNVTFSEYNKFVCDTVTETYSHLLNEQLHSQLIDMLNKKLAPAPTEITVQALFDKVKSYWEDECRDHEEIEVEWNSRENTWKLKFIHPENDWETFSITCYNHRNDGFTIGYIRENDGERTSKKPIESATYAMGVNGFFYQLYCAKTKITGFENMESENIYIGWD